MGYTKQNFIDGQTLTAAKLNHMEAGIAAAWDMAGSGTGGGAVTGIPGAAGDLCRGQSDLIREIFCHFPGIGEKTYTLASRDRNSVTGRFLLIAGRAGADIIRA